MIRCVSGLQSKDGAIVHTKAEDATQHESGLRGRNGWRRKNDERKGFGRAPRISIPAITFVIFVVKMVSIASFTVFVGIDKGFDGNAGP